MRQDAQKGGRRTTTAAGERDLAFLVLGKVRGGCCDVVLWESCDLLLAAFVRQDRFFLRVCVCEGMLGMYM